MTEYLFKLAKVMWKEFKPVRPIWWSNSKLNNQTTAQTKLQTKMEASLTVVIQIWEHKSLETNDWDYITTETWSHERTGMTEW
ncbi:MAG: hypothetical protein ACTS6G_02335 [Candidatus Hodgkinia cicadicola]